MSRHRSQQDDGLTPLERAFVEHYVVTKNATEAATKYGGYKGKHPNQHGYAMLRRPHVQMAVDAKLAALAKKLDLSAEKILTDIARVADKAEKAREYGAALKGHELLGKHLKLFVDRAELTGKDGAPLTDPAQMTDAMLAAIAKLGAGK